MIEVDLVDPSGPNIVDTAQADPNVWVTLAAQANQLAAAKGFVIETGTLLNEPSTTLGSVADVQNWLSRQGTAATLHSGSASSPPEQTDWSLVAICAGLIVGTVGLFWAALRKAGR
jgi:hypothetical protein